MRVSMYAVVLCVLAGCGANPRVEDLSPVQRRKAATMQVFKGDPGRPVVAVGMVEGLSCHRNAYSTNDVSEAEAIAGLKLRAAQLGADAVVSVVCQKDSGTDWRNNCFGSVKCVGDAVRFQ